MPRRAYDATVKIDRTVLRLKKLPDDLRASLKVEINDLVTKMRDKARANVAQFFHVITGDFQKTIKKSVRVGATSVVGGVFSKSKLAHLLEKGVRPHDIRAKNAKALAFLGGQFAEVVHHPGFRGHTIINAAFQEMLPEVYERLNATVATAIKENETAA